jgi:hypothetical protein
MGAFKLGALLERVTSTATAGATTTLLNNSRTYQRFTGSLNQTVQLPDATTMVVGIRFVIQNRSSGTLTINDGSAALLATIAPNAESTFRVLDVSTVAGIWDQDPDNEYQSQSVTSEAELTTAITNATSAGGGVICLINSFSISSAHTIPVGTLLIGRRGASVVTLTSSGSLTLADGVKMEDIWLTTALTSGNMLNLSNNYSVVRDCRFNIPPTSTGSCIYVTGNSNRTYNNVFVGVAFQSAAGINFASGYDNVDYDSVFLP